MWDELQYQKTGGCIERSFWRGFDVAFMKLDSCCSVPKVACASFNISAEGGTPANRNSGCQSANSFAQSHRRSEHQHAACGWHTFSEEECCNPLQGIKIWDLSDGALGVACDSYGV